MHVACRLQLAMRTGALPIAGFCGTCHHFRCPYPPSAKPPSLQSAVSGVPRQQHVRPEPGAGGADGSPPFAGIALSLSACCWQQPGIDGDPALLVEFSLVAGDQGAVPAGPGPAAPVSQRRLGGRPGDASNLAGPLSLSSILDAQVSLQLINK